MAEPVKFYAWAVPAFGVASLPDHTWVTTYNSQSIKYGNVQQVVGAKQFFWYCWGSFHRQGGTPVNATGFLGEKAGDASLARCLVEPNADSRTVRKARGTIFTYGRHGVCHQLANQVLYATGAQGAPLTVAKARGYWASVFNYGTYGVPEETWIRKRDSCSAQRARLLQGEEMARVPDEFEMRAQAVLEHRSPELLEALLALREEAQRTAVEEWPKSGSPTAEALNARNQQMLDRAAALLGPENFEKIFDFPPSQGVNLVNPAIKQAADAAEDGRSRTAHLHVATRAKKPSGQATVTLRHLAARLSQEHELTKREGEAILGELVGLITKHLKKGDRIRIGGLGVLVVRKRAARMGRNPATGKPIKIKGSKKIAFRQSSELKVG
jgi:nucleoid DNA-binding protein